METIDQIKIDESGTLEPVLKFYNCSKGYLTFGHGRNLETNQPTRMEWKTLSRYIDVFPTEREAMDAWAEYLFLNDVEDAERGLGRAIGKTWPSAPDEARIIAINMRFNMGPSFNASKWPSFFRCFRNHDWAGCAVQMQYTDVTKTVLSKWYTDVDNHEDSFVGRAERLVKAMEALAV